MAVPVSKNVYGIPNLIGLSKVIFLFTESYENLLLGLCELSILRSGCAYMHMVVACAVSPDDKFVLVYVKTRTEYV